ncbi:MAG: hypothetical protein HWE26_22345 [Alteromonadaceae bacterium]|nr:hypothetical protein [Alteromonadaceae bacterium]
MAKTKKKHGEIVGKLVSRETREHVGYLYEWNTGERQNGWFGDPKTDVVIEKLEDGDDKRSEEN